jgi:iron complex transport system ATP-binding protein
MLELRGVSMRYGTYAALDRVSAAFAEGTLSAIVGPNGAGKSTMLSIVSGLMTPTSGDAWLDGKPVREWRRHDFASRVSLVPQAVRIDFPFTARQVVLMGRTPHRSGYFEDPADHAAADWAMEMTDTARFHARDFRSLSGGERQRVVLACALAQQPRVLLLDEPTTFLDLKHQIAIYEILRERSRAGQTVVAVTHDLGLARAYSDRVLVLCCGQVASDGPPAEAVSADVLRRVFEVDPEALRRIYGG